MRSFKLIICIICYCLSLNCLYAKEATLSKEQEKKLKEHQDRIIEKEENIKKAKALGTIRVYPDILTNLSTASDKKKIRYIQIRLDLIAADRQYSDFINNNQPLYRNKLILFFNRQPAKNFSTKKRKAAVKKRIIKLINSALYPEIKKNVIKDIIIQRLIVE